MNRKVSTFIIALAWATAAAATANAATLPDGEYVCSLNPRMQLGSIWIKGKTYVGPGRDRSAASHRFELTGSGTINWSAPMGGMDTDGNHVIGTVLKDAGGGKTGFDIQFTTQAGRTQIASCTPA
jgi:hypothetical protein